MKAILYSIVLTILGVSNLFGQGATCATADPFCTNNNYTFPASTSTTAQSGPDYGCLGSQPNPSWYYIQVATSGVINIDLTNSANVDIDFICWGPFNTLGSACSNLTGGGTFSTCTLFGTYPCGNIVDCSFSTAAQEQVNIPNAVAGQYYMMLITNFSGLPTDISANTASGTTGSTNCNIVPPPNSNCIINTFSANISACNPNSTFNVTGDFTYTDNPGTGTLIVEINNGTSTFTQTFNPPFVDGQTYNYAINNIPADGAASTITVYFSADPTCSETIPYTAVSDCSCAADIGTFSTSLSGQTSTNYVLCYGDQITLTPNNDYTPPANINDPNYPYVPGVGWLIYSCPPSVATTPQQGTFITNDPCLVGVASFGTFTDINDLGWLNSFPAGTFTNNTIYFVPCTFYNTDSLLVSNVNTTIDCYDLGPAFAVQYLTDIVDNQTQDCAAGEVTATFSGGLPALNNSNFTVVPGSLTPATATFVNTSCANNGSIVLGGLSVGNAYSFDVSDGNGCTVTISGTFQGSNPATMTYPQTAYCQNATNPLPTVTGSTGGTFSSTAGCSINANTGLINLAASTPGTYTITYIGPGALCPPVATFIVTINALPVVSAGPDQTVCSGTNVTLTGSGAQNYSWDNGITNGVPFSATNTQTYTVTGTSAAGCQATDQVLVTIEPTTPPQFSANVTSGCAPLTVTFTNLSGGNNCSWSFGDGSSGVGCGTVTHTFSNVGCYDISLITTTASGCVATATQNSYICVVPNPVASFTPVPSLLTQLNSVTQMNNSSTNANQYQWDFGDGFVSSQVNPLHEFPYENPGSYVIELIAISPFGCRDTAYATVVVQETLLYFVPNAFTPDGDEFNQTFVPVFTSGFDPYDFNMVIFDRWGEIIFETNNSEIGWDGSYHGDLVKEGVYTWRIEFKTRPTDKRQTAVGHVSVLR